MFRAQTQAIYLNHRKEDNIFDISLTEKLQQVCKGEKGS